MLKWFFINKNRMFVYDNKPVTNKIPGFVKTGTFFIRNKLKEKGLGTTYSYKALNI